MTAPRTTRAAGATWPPAEIARRRAASDRKKRPRPHEVGAERLGQLHQPVINDRMPQLNADRAPSVRHHRDPTEPDSVRPRPLEVDALDLILGEVEVLHALQALDHLFVLVGGQRRHQLAVDVALHRACELRPSMAARIDAEEPRRREVEPVADPSAEESSRQKAAHESADERFAHPRTARIDTPDPPKRTAVISARIPSAVSSAPRPPRSRPIGPWTVASCSSVIPSLRSAEARAGGVARPRRVSAVR